MTGSRKWPLLMAGLLATAVFTAPTAEASSYVVQKGDTLTKIAKLHNTTVSQLQKWNSLKNDSIYVTQKLVVSQQKVTSKVNKNTPIKKQVVQAVAPKKTNAKPAPSIEPTVSAPALSYKVMSGDTLTKIAKAFNVSVADIKIWNNLTTDSIFVGQTLTINTERTIENPVSTIPNSTELVGDLNVQLSPEEIGKQLMADAEARIAAQLAKEKAITSVPNDSLLQDYTKVIEIAQSLIGTPYVFGGNSSDGLDCSGFVQYVYTAVGKNINRLDSESYFMNSSTIVTTPVAGDIVFFKNTYKAGISHMGIYLGDDQFIHAGTNGVEISKLSYSYWDTRFVAFKRFNIFIQ